MKRILKWTGIAIGGFLGIIVVAIVVLYFLGGSKINKTYEIDVKAVAIPAEGGSPEDGWPVAMVRLCQECHGDNLQGDIVVDDPLFATIAGSNLTSGKGGVGGTYTDIDWVRAIRHGVRPNGKPLLLMPSHEFYKFSDADLGQIIAYVKSVPPVDNEVTESKAGPLGRIIIPLSGDILPASIIDHTGPRPPEPAPGVTVEYGEYMSFVCSLCHGEELSGGTVPEYGPDSPPAPNLTPRGTLGRWSEEEFIRTLRSGKTPYGKNLNDEFMPWKSVGKFTDDQLKALWLYLSTLPARESTR